MSRTRLCQGQCRVQLHADRSLAPPLLHRWSMRSQAESNIYRSVRTGPAMLTVAYGDGTQSFGSMNLLAVAGCVHIEIPQTLRLPTPCACHPPGRRRVRMCTLNPWPERASAGHRNGERANLEHDKRVDSVERNRSDNAREIIDSQFNAC